MSPTGGTCHGVVVGLPVGGAILLGVVSPTGGTCHGAVVGLPVGGAIVRGVVSPTGGTCHGVVVGLSGVVLVEGMFQLIVEGFCGGV